MEMIRKATEKPFHLPSSRRLQRSQPHTYIKPPINLKIIIATTFWLAAQRTLKVASSRKPYTSSRFRPYMSDRKPHRKADEIIPVRRKKEKMETRYKMY